ncbi:MAG: monofunctional biosynthetic peptidoglycan transglycosylase [Pseudomonadota bacterium]
MGRVFKVLAVVCALAVTVPAAVIALYGVVDPPALPVLRQQWKGAPVDQRWVRLDEMSPGLVRAVVMAEDARFCLHWGVDLNQLRIVVKDALEGGRPRGASTITMQTVKNVFLWPSRSYVRKAIEVPLAFLMDLILSKDRILEIYLNSAQWGSVAYGAEAAAQRHFGVSAAQLSERQALALATALPAPSLRNPRRPGPRQERAMARVARELRRAPWVFGCLPPAIRP